MVCVTVIHFCITLLKRRVIHDKKKQKNIPPDLKQPIARSVVEFAVATKKYIVFFVGKTIQINKFICVRLC